MAQRKRRPRVVEALKEEVVVIEKDVHDIKIIP